MSNFWSQTQSGPVKITIELEPTETAQGFRMEIEDGWLKSMGPDSIPDLAEILAILDDKNDETTYELSAGFKQSKIYTLASLTEQRRNQLIEIGLPSEAIDIILKSGDHQ